jgi:DNA-binding response OmpR family regulator
MSRRKILIIEDERDILEVMTYNVQREGYSVLTSRDGAKGLELARKESPDMVLLDLMLPSLDGLEVCRRLKEDLPTRNIPIIMVTAKGEESDVVIGLGMGADDYVVKPFSPRELVARVKAVFRRGRVSDAEPGTDRIQREGIILDPIKFQFRVDGESVPLTATEFRLLHLLASHPGRVFTRSEMLNRVVGEDAAVIDRNIDVHVRSLRKKLGPYRDLIETQRGVGYRFSDDES